MRRIPTQVRGTAQQIAWRKLHRCLERTVRQKRAEPAQPRYNSSLLLFSFLPFKLTLRNLHKISYPFLYSKKKNRIFHCHTLFSHHFQYRTPRESSITFPGLLLLSPSVHSHSFHIHSSHSPSLSLSHCFYVPFLHIYLSSSLTITLYVIHSPFNFPAARQEEQKRIQKIVWQKGEVWLFFFFLFLFFNFIKLILVQLNIKFET